ncbi:HD domain-containing protein [Arcanobacterium buesumense]|uniref:HD domain-containing protein n=1 Tax=Arcanobacterium buesumense TaxID=2722751 RepID=A0A6H2END5_9ACTO|nr:HD domain-containing protein [Arcanobacterium buesumense]QJC22590.1 HD domain-containing protein [Arcanobacterium buesumense]
MMISAREAFEPAVEFARHYLLSDERIVGGKPVSARARRYRFEHSVRVARIGRTVARGGGLDEDLLALGCMLHDVGKFDAQRPVDHGRAGAVVVNDFLRDLGLAQAQRLEIVQGIAMHTDDMWNPRSDGEGTEYRADGRPYLVFDTEPSMLARSIGDCDNIDRFGAYRVADTLHYVDFLSLSTADQRSWLADYVAKLRRLRQQQCHTHTASVLWREALDVQLAFFSRLAAEICD